MARAVSKGESVIRGTLRGQILGDEGKDFGFSLKC